MDPMVPPTTTQSLQRSQCRRKISLLPVVLCEISHSAIDLALTLLTLAGQRNTPPLLRTRILSITTTPVPRPISDTTHRCQPTPARKVTLVAIGGTARRCLPRHNCSWYTENVTGIFLAGHENLTLLIDANYHPKVTLKCNIYNTAADHC